MTFRQFLLKLHTRCNLACTYCYVYEAADQSWRTKVRRMEHSTVRQVAARIADYRRPPGGGTGAERSDGPISVILHGGEPLLVGHRHLDGTLRILRDALDGTGEVAWGMQTNGVLLGQDPELLRVLRRYGVRVGVSLDGTAAGHDRYRKFADGRGSHGAVARALRILGDGADRELFSGVLCTIDLDADPVETYEALLEFSPPRMDLLLPHGTWDVPPPGLAARRVPPGRPPGSQDGPCDGAQDSPGATPYADWLCAVFDRWYGAPRRETGIRLFEELIMLLLGGRASSEMVGNGPLDLVVVETDGSLELADSLKVSYDGAAATPLDVFRDAFTVAEAHPAFRSPELSPVCASCPLVAVCGGGLYAHRYSHGPGDPFAHPTVYCADMAALIGHIRRRLEHDLARLKERRPAGSVAR
ncbi:FxsB family radical SAM/SPASM domain protein [Streptomyces sp. NBC_00683]|uniref:FxsB family cyclophane-forming radical SAM/SPASM peptide maturase n=1 Tax=Streptomyces sp. NBC_00683 TaxID=2903670 RepID=UPI002E310D89|nr:FxsB family cyclophane-forming radical SAM/SPASM peptide maturase [Streptomyces sp. NBC_00683]